VAPERIELEFNEYVDRQSVEESIFISPYVGDLEFEWSGPEVTVSFPEDLREGITYVVTVGTDVVDVRSGNRMAGAFSLAFSTGDSIDRGKMSGRVFDPEPEGLMVFAYRLGPHRADSLDPARVKPDYITQTGEGGSFTLPHIAFGVYRVFAIRDEYRNLVYDRGVDGYGVATFDPFVNPGTPEATRVWFRMTKDDTTRPFLSSVTPVDRHALRLQFSEPLDTLSVVDAVVTVEDTSTREELDVEVLYLNRRNRSRVGIVLGQPLDGDRAYRVVVEGVTDEVGNPLDSANASIDFTGSDEPDTTRPFPSLVGITDSSLGIPMDQVFELDFSEPVVPGRLTSAVVLEDADSTEWPVKFDWLNGRSLRMTPEKPLSENSWYVIRVLLDSIRDYQGNAFTDSTVEIRFETLNLRTTGSIAGIVLDANPAAGQGPVYVSATMAGQAGGSRTTVRLDTMGSFLIETLVKGLYTVDAYIDADTSGSYSFGLPFPFLHSERFTVYEDSLRVRARWPYEGMLLRFE
jgi:hypothetical protein